ncbi:MAG: hypothetical protein H6924_06045 [Alphaproteobacteria bacterium]|nr:hypothetical protein [Alphaproteobacteria bacterium]
MDFTYPFAFVMAAVFAVLPSFPIRWIFGPVPKYVRYVLIALIALTVFALSINWTAVGHMPLPFMAFDFVLIVGAAVLGALLGTLPLKAKATATQP